MTVYNRLELSVQRGFLLVIIAAAFGALFLLFVNNSDVTSYQIYPKPYTWTASEAGYQQPDVTGGSESSDSNRVIMKSHVLNQSSGPAGQSYAVSLQARDLHLQRKKHVISVCAKHHLNTSSNTIRARLMYSDKYKLAYHNIPKIGSTFLVQMFMVLNRGADKSDAIFGSKRMDVHTRTGGLWKRLDGVSLRSVLTLIPTRNPYTRLYSAYVDKVYLPLASSLASAVSSFGDKPGSCGVYDTFESFLKYALRDKSSKIMYDHYISPYKMASRLVCSLDNFMLVKQETFSSDVEYALRVSDVDREDWDAIFGALHDRRVDATVPGIVRTIYSRASPLSRTCHPWMMVAKRTWTSFQIQGFLSNDLDFPVDKFSSNSSLYENPEYLIKIILESIKSKPLSSEESRAQRRAALLTEYKKVNPNIIKQIQTVYAMDFEIYEYDTDLNSIR